VAALDLLERFFPIVAFWSLGGVFKPFFLYCLFLALVVYARIFTNKKLADYTTNLREKIWKN
jgi:hypothetical protein